MSSRKPKARHYTDAFIHVKGARQNNLKGFDLDLPLGKLNVITGPSGSGKSSLAFDTIYAEGQRRYVETFSPYTRQFFERMDKPKVDAILGIPPAIAIEQVNNIRSTRSTVGTITEINDYLKMLFPRNAIALFGRRQRKAFNGCFSPNTLAKPHLFSSAFQCPQSQQLKTSSRSCNLRATFVYCSLVTSFARMMSPP